MKTKNKQNTRNKQKNFKSGFTLLELLVVVIIIGILAAIALPQYRLAVDKAHVSKYLDICRTIREAQERYFMENGEYSVSLNVLDIEFDPACKSPYSNMYYNCMGGDVEIDNYNGNDGMVRIIYCPSLRGIKQNSYTDCPNASELSIWFYYAYSKKETKRNKIICENRTKRGKRICKALGL